MVAIDYTVSWAHFQIVTDEKYKNEIISFY